MNRSIVVAGVSASVVVASAVAWRRNPRIGTRLVNEVIDPFLVGRGLAGTGRSEIGTLEHVGRRSGLRRLTPVHPVATEDGYRVIVPLGERSEWARNVLAAGHCRLQLHDQVIELDEPDLVDATDVPGISRIARLSCRLLGFRYLLLHTFSLRNGSLTAEVVPEPAPGVIATPLETPATETPATLVGPTP